MESAVYISIFKVTVLPFLHWLLVDQVDQVARHIPGGKKWWWDLVLWRYANDGGDGGSDWGVGVGENGTGDEVVISSGIVVIVSATYDDHGASNWGVVDHGTGEGKSGVG